MNIKKAIITCLTIIGMGVAFSVSSDAEAKTMGSWGMGNSSANACFVDNWNGVEQTCAGTYAWVQSLTFDNPQQSYTYYPSVCVTHNNTSASMQCVACAVSNRGGSQYNCTRWTTISTSDNCVSLGSVVALFPNWSGFVQCNMPQGDYWWSTSW